ncbi:MAG: hypothetical protein K9K64_02465, partial [Desulfohalobiaceae bacterium]|nr:hypothetical protein [Desulfohalobiaceae bacterium]
FVTHLAASFFQGLLVNCQSMTRVKSNVKNFFRGLQKKCSNSNCTGPVKQRVQEIVFVDLPEADDIQQISGLKKLKGYNAYYRLRYSDYRLGISIVEDKWVFNRVLHRKDIYRYFP